MSPNTEFECVVGDLWGRLWVLGITSSMYNTEMYRTRNTNFRQMASSTVMNDEKAISYIDLKVLVTPTL